MCGGRMMWVCRGAVFWWKKGAWVVFFGVGSFLERIVRGKARFFWCGGGKTAKGLRMKPLRCFLFSVKPDYLSRFFKSNQII